MLNKSRLEHSDILELWALIPLGKRLKPPPGHESGQSHLVFGLSPRMPEHFTNASFSLKHTVRALVKFVLQHFPTFRFTTLTLATNSSKGPHRDLNNADAPAFLTCLTQQTGGDLWIHNTHGKHPMNHSGQTLYGDVVPIKQKPTVFHSRAQFHCCTPWKHGPRTTLTAFPTAEDLDLWATEAKRRASESRKGPGPRQLLITDFAWMRTSANGLPGDPSAFPKP